MIVFFLLLVVFLHDSIRLRVSSLLREENDDEEEGKANELGVGEDERRVPSE